MAPEDRTALLIDAASLRRFAEKLVRGTAYYLDQVFIPRHYKIEMQVVSQEHSRDFRWDIKRHGGTTFKLGLWHRVHRAVLKDDPAAGLYQFELWKGQFIINVTVLPEDEKASPTETEAVAES